MSPPPVEIGLAGVIGYAACAEVCALRCLDERGCEIVLRFAPETAAPLRAAIGRAAAASQQERADACLPAFDP